MTMRRCMRLILYAGGTLAAFAGDTVPGAIFIAAAVVCEHLDRRGA